MNLYTTWSIGIIGAGTMGRGIAQVAALAGHSVHLYDTQPNMLRDVRQFLQETLGRLAEKGKISEEEAGNALSRIYYHPKLDVLYKCELIIEAIVENSKAKQEVLHEISTLSGEDVILASNTSSLSITQLASATTYPHRFLGIHFFNPAPLMQLVEVIPGLQTDPSLLLVILPLIQSWGKTPVVAKDTPGFIVNRIARPYYGEALRMLEEDIAPVHVIDAAMEKIGRFRMGPFRLMDLIGNDINYAVTRDVYEQSFYDPRYKPAITQLRLVQAGRYGRKSGVGFYDYRTEQEEYSIGFDESWARTTIVDRIVAMLINEAADALYWKIADRDDIDKAMTLGVNYPKGLLRWADEWGLGRVIEIIDALHDTYKEDRYRVSPLLRHMHLKNKRFYEYNDQ